MTIPAIKVVLLSSLGYIRIWLYPENASKKLNNRQPEAFFTKESMLGSGYKSLGQALFRLVKLTHILHFPMAFFTNTTFSCYSGYWIYLMWSAFKSLWAYSRMTRHLSSLNFLLLWTTVLTLSSMVSRWHRKSGSIPGIFADDHAKAFMCSDITSAILSSNSLHNEVSSLNFFPLISLSWTSPTGSGRLSLMASASAIHFGFPDWIAIV